MLILEHMAPIYLHREPADMRKSFDGLLGLVHQAGLVDPLSGAWFVFRNRRGDRLKVLYFDRDPRKLACASGTNGWSVAGFSGRVFQAR